MKPTMQTGVVVALLAGLCGCSTMASFTAEKFGQAKRVLLVRRLVKACEAQQKLQDAFQRALEQFESLVKFEGGNQQKPTDQMSAAMARCEARAKDVPARIAEVDRAGQNLFREWKAASEKHPNEMYRRDRGAKRRNTERDYNQMMAVLRSAESKIEPTLSAFRNQVEAVQAVLLDPAFQLDNGLNERAQISVQDESARLAAQVDFLAQNLSDSIAQADLFIQQIGD